MNIRNKFPIDHFIKKFEAIPEAKWHVGQYRNQFDETCRCALGHCGMFYNEEGREEMTDEARALIFWAARKGIGVPDINDGNRVGCVGSTPKQRILNFLRDLKHEEDVILEEFGRKQ